MKLKKTIYIISFTVLGFLVSLLVHAGIEIPIINLLMTDFDRYSFGLTWDQWEAIHFYGAIVLAVAGILFGCSQGKYWWQVIYIENRRFWRRWIRDDYGKK